mgnify:CR=1 FL=1
MPRSLATLLQRNGPLMNRPHRVAHHEHAMTGKQNQIGLTHRSHRLSRTTGIVHRAAVLGHQSEASTAQGR